MGKEQRPEPVRRSGMGRFDFSRSSQRATNSDGSEFTDRNGNNVIKDNFGNRHLLRDGESKDFSYQEGYNLEISQEDGVISANVHMDQDPVIDKIIEGADGMLRFHQKEGMGKVRELMSGDLADRFEKEIASDDEGLEDRIRSLKNLVSMGRQYQQQRGQGGGLYETDDKTPPKPSMVQEQRKNPDRFFDEFVSTSSEEMMTRRSSGNLSGKTRNTMLCNSCNGEVSSSMRFCPGCGERLQ